MPARTPINQTTIDWRLGYRAGGFTEGVPQGYGFNSQWKELHYRSQCWAEIRKKLEALFLISPKGRHFVTLKASLGEQRRLKVCLSTVHVRYSLPNFEGLLEKKYEPFVERVQIKKAHFVITHFSEVVRSIADRIPAIGKGLRDVINLNVPKEGVQPHEEYDGQPLLVSLISG